MFCEWELDVYVPYMYICAPHDLQSELDMYVLSLSENTSIYTYTHTRHTRTHETHTHTYSLTHTSVVRIFAMCAASGIAKTLLCETHPMSYQTAELCATEKGRGHLHLDGEVYPLMAQMERERWGC